MQYRAEQQTEISFPIGGIGSGSVGLAGNGSLIDWEIFNHPNKGSILDYTHFALRCRGEGVDTARVLQGDWRKDWMGQYENTRFRGFGFGPAAGRMVGFPHFRRCVFTGEFPMAEVALSDDGCPVSARLTAFNPFIPLDAEHSSLPAAFFAWEITNKGDQPLQCSLAFSLANPFPRTRNIAAADGRGLWMLYDGADPTQIDYGELAVLTDAEAPFAQEYWYRGKWQDGIVSFWRDFTADTPLGPRRYDTPAQKDHGTVSAGFSLAPGETARIRFVLAWYIPNRENDWSGTPEGRWKNYYATRFASAMAVARYALKNWEMLESKTRIFRDALFSASLPPCVIDAASACLAVLKSPTVMRLEDGSFYGWEGVHEKSGSCEGTCQHVWNYAYALCYLFPELERSVRDLEFQYSTDGDGRMRFRLGLPLGAVLDFRACVDGQMGAVFKSYREWKLSGDDTWLKKRWPDIQKALAYAWSNSNPDGWDRDRDGVLEGRQHHTLDMELFGPSAWLEGLYLLALKAAAEMALFAGDRAAAEEYNALYEKGAAWTRTHLFNGEYFMQRIDLSDKRLLEAYDAVDAYWNDEAGEIKYQIGNGSALDQLLALWHSKLLGIEGIFDPGQARQALRFMFAHNFKPSLRDFVNPWRVFSMDDEAGAVICDYPEQANKPRIPLPYCEETMTGFEYAFAGLLIAQGMTAEGQRVVQAIRDRYDGRKRNPWNEIECGSNYARSMAAFALLPLYAGFSADLPHHCLRFAPRLPAPFQCPFSVATGWGRLILETEEARIVLADGELLLSALQLPFARQVTAVMLDDQAVPFRFENGTLTFALLTVRHSLRICLR